MLTVALALVSLILVVRVDVFSLSYPVQVTLQVLLQLLLLTQLLEVSASFRLLSLFGKLSGIKIMEKKKEVSAQTQMHTGILKDNRFFIRK